MPQELTLTKSGKHFVCAICGNDLFREVTSSEVVDDVVHRDTRETAECSKSELCLGYECCGCTVMFGDPDKFIKGKE
jgi:hypothetical protein